jgi:adenosylcobinamide kinase/adenosylcobinamide-phosphate guanylyltransferase
MLYLITGGSASGKSEFAEKTAVKLGDNKKMLYVATMQIYDEESRKRVEKHRKMREGKGFETVECQTDISRIGNIINSETETKINAETKTEINAGTKAEDSVILIECLSNLLANEMFAENGNLNGVENNIENDTETDIKSSIEINTENNTVNRGVNYNINNNENNNKNAQIYIVEPIIKLAEKNEVVIVTNEIFSDGANYDECTLEYIACLGYINRKLAEKATAVAEVVCSLPVVIKGEF